MSAPLVLLAGAAELPRDDEWLSPAERAILHRSRVPKRRQDFRLGRWAAKRVLALLYGDEEMLAAGRFEIRPARGGAPVPYRDGAPLEATLSISHSGSCAVAAIQRGEGRLGCDLERIEERSHAFVGDYFTAAEQAFAEAGPHGGRRATLVWSAKEAVMKALGEGLRLPPPTVEVVPDLHFVTRAGWRRFAVAAPPAARELRGFWRDAGEFLLTAAASEEPRLVAGTLRPAPEAARPSLSSLAGPRL
ncbi:MAG TPA: 4'-phosphopantetheinyl transferase superfamily protein [Vicinamibacteria bacterium]